MFCDVNFMYRLYHDCARTLKRNLSGKLAIVELSGDFGFARNSSKHGPCTLTSFSRFCMPRCACTRDVTCKLYCSSLQYNIINREQHNKYVYNLASHCRSIKHSLLPKFRSVKSFSEFLVFSKILSSIPGKE